MYCHLYTVYYCILYTDYCKYILYSGSAVFCKLKVHIKHAALYAAVDDWLCSTSVMRGLVCVEELDLRTTSIDVSLPSLIHPLCFCARVLQYFII